jgi:hypothetical protein
VTRSRPITLLAGQASLPATVEVGKRRIVVARSGTGCHARAEEGRAAGPDTCPDVDAGSEEVAGGIQRHPAEQRR